MSTTLGLTRFLIGACTLLGAFACGEAPAPGEAERVQQTRQAMAAGVDVVLQEVSAPAVALPGGPLEVTLTVCNQGTWEDLVSMDVYLSSDPDITYEDTFIGNLFGGWLLSGQCLSISATLTASVPEGSWYVGAAAYGYYGGDYDLSNNWRVGGLITVGAQPDFLIETVSTPVSVKPGEPFTASVKVCNHGTVSGDTEVQLVLSKDTTITFTPGATAPPQDLPLNAFASGPLEPGQCTTQQVPTSVQPPREGNWHLGAVADPANAVLEFNEANNTRASKGIGIGNRPDFLISSVSGPAFILPGETFPVSVKVCNQGTVDAGTQVQLVLSEDTTIRFSSTQPGADQDLPLSSFATEVLAAGQCATHQVPTNAQPPHEGNWYLGAVADPANAVVEFSEGNNTRASKRVSIGHQPDFLIQAVSAPASSLPGEPFTASVKVCNQGTAAGDTQVHLVLLEAPGGAQDLLLASFASGPLAPGACATKKVQTSAQPPYQGTWYLGAVADPANDVVEFNETNNTRASKALHIGSLPDFLVQSVVGPTPRLPGDLYSWVAITFCNQGTAAGTFWADVFLSTDQEIGWPDDLYLTHFPSTWLAAGQCISSSVAIHASYVLEGDWYPGVIITPGMEFDTTNNTRVGPVIHIGYRPDFVIQSVSGPASATPGSPITASVKVCNQGTVGGSTEVHLVLSEDTAIEFSSTGAPAQQDLPLAAFTVGPLAAGQCTTRNLEAEVQPPHEGTWYLGAVADPANTTAEFDETNNTRASKAMGIGHGPDYVIQSVSAPATVLPGAPFTASVKVCNQGNASGAGTQVLLVLSADTAIRFSSMSALVEQDLPLNSFTSGPLAAGQCATQQLQVSVEPPYEGAWYLGAVADPSHSEWELIESNNTRASKVIGFGSGPDYVIQSMSSPANITPWGALTASVTVCNQGTTAGLGTQVHLVLSHDDIIPSQDAVLYSFDTGPLAAGQCTTRQIETSDPFGSAGTRYLGVVADPDNSEQEIFETNNTHVRVIGIDYRPDLYIQAVSGPPGALPGAPFTASVTVCNQGTYPAWGEVMWVLSEDASIHFDAWGPPEEQDLPLATVSIEALGADQCMTYQAELSAQVPHEGLWYLGAVVDPTGYVYEFDETNNTRAGKPMGIGHQPDLIVQKASGPASVLPGAPFTASVTVCNQGTVDSGSAQVHLVLSEDTTVFSSAPQAELDPLVASFATEPLAAGQCATRQLQASAPVPHEGLWHLGVMVDPGNVVLEFTETNNTYVSKPIGIGYQPDLIIQTVSAPPHLVPGAPFTAKVTVCNQGTAGSGGTEVEWGLSSTGSPEEQEPPLASFAVGPLAAGQCATQQVQASAQAPHEGSWYLVAVVDPDDAVPEFLETNNAHASKAFGIGYRPDFVIQSVRGPRSVLPGDWYAATVTVCNQGTLGGFTLVDLVISRDTTLEPPPFVIDNLYFELEAGQCATQERSNYAYVPSEGIWYLGAVATAPDVPGEFNETNNTRFGDAMSVGYGPDYVVQSVSGPASVRPGELFTASVTVCNQGALYGVDAQVHLVLSEDAAIQFSSSGDPADSDLPIATVTLGLLESGRCTTQQVQTQAQPPHEGAWYLGAVAEPGSSEQEINPTDNTRNGGLMGIGYSADYTISSVSAPASVEPGAPFTAAVTVCNQGTAGSAGAQVRVALSSSDSPEAQQLPLTSFAVGALGAGECITQQVQTSLLPPGEGLWYLIAMADPDNAVPELAESNNARASKAIGVGYQADFRIQAVRGPPSVLPEQPFVVEVAVCNEGTVSASTEVRLVLSEDATVRFSPAQSPAGQDLPLAAFTSEALEPGQCETQQLEVAVQVPYEGLWYLGAVADPADVVPEFKENNNTRASKPMGIGAMPDLVIRSVKGPASGSPGGTGEVKVTTCNQGTVSDPLLVGVLLSSDPEFSTSEDLEVGFMDVGWLEPGQCVTSQIPVTWPWEAGAWHLGALAYSYGWEFDMDNNTRVGGMIEIHD